MDDRPKVIITFQNGKIIKETRGFKGSRCIEATKIIEEIVAPCESKISYKDEYLASDGKISEEGLLA